MLVNFRNKYVFLHSRKSAGSSIKVSLARFLSDDDIIIGALDDVLRSGHVPPCLKPQGARKFAEFLARQPSLAEHWLKRFSDRRIALNHNRVECKKWELDDGHAGIEDIRTKILRDQWQGMTKIAVVRNPWDRLVSFFRWREKVSGKTLNFDKFVSVACQQDITQRYERAELFDDAAFIYDTDKSMGLDIVIRFEYLNADMRLLESAEPSFDGWLPSAKSNGVAIRRGYRDWYSAKNRSLVKTKFRRIIEEFDYGF